MSWIAAAVIGGGALNAGGALLAGKNAADAAAENSANQNQYTADVQQEYMNQLAELLGGAGSDVWGEVPEWAPYEPVDITRSQGDTIRGNLRHLDIANQLAAGTNALIWENDLNRVRALTPGYDQSVANLSAEIGARLRGQTTLGDTFSNLVGDRAEVAAALGTPGTQQPALAKDLGLKRQDLFNSGASMFTQWLAVANESISPISNQMRPQQMFFSPQERLDADLLQAQLIQQSTQSGYNLAAMPDPEAQGEFNAALSALGTSASAAVGAAPAVVSPNTGLAGALSAFGQGVSSYGTLKALTGGGALGAQATQPTTSSGGIAYQPPSGYTAYFGNNGAVAGYAPFYNTNPYGYF